MNRSRQVEVTDEMVTLVPQAAGLLQAAIRLHQEGDLSRAEAIYLAILDSDPGHADALHLTGVIAHQQGRNTEAVERIARAISISPNCAIYYSNYANVLTKLGRLDEALLSYDQAIRLRPGDRSIFYNRGNTLKEINRLDEALSSYDEAIRLKPDCPSVHYNRGIVLHRLKRLDEALSGYNEAIRLKPDNASAFKNRAYALKELKRLDEALLSYNEAIRLMPDDASVFFGRGNTLRELKRLDEALSSYDEAIRLTADFAFLTGPAAHVRCQLCQWQQVDELVKTISHGVMHGTLMSTPFPLLALTDDPLIHRRAAEQWALEKVSKTGTLAPLTVGKRDRKIHVAYLSADFHDHATSYLMAEMFELHDRDRFEITAISFGPDDGRAMRQRIVAAFDRFEDIRTKSDYEVASMCREMGIDIAIDLKGYTSDARPGIFSERCAPIQISWLGYPGTMGVSFIDYIVADHTLIAEDEFHFYAEKIIRLPDTYQVNGSRSGISEKKINRIECGLPEEGFVFCCFNNIYKILPATFNVWMRILQQVPDSVLWLLEDNLTASENLRAEAAARGIDPDRLVFARRMLHAEHLARHRVADLFLDTWPYNAHTTASDALRAGLPVLTRSGRSFASRVAASLLKAADLSCLVTRSDQAYEDLAVELAKDRKRLQTLRDQLASNRESNVLFDCGRFAKNIESAYQQVMERLWSGHPPAHLDVHRDHSNLGGKPAGAVQIKPVEGASINLSKGNISPFSIPKGASKYQSESIIRRGLASNPTERSAWHSLLSLVVEDRRPQEVIRLSRRALEIFPDDPEIQSRLAVALVESDRLDEAEELLNSFSKRVGALPIRVASILALIGQFSDPKRSLRICEKIIEKVPDNWEAACLRRSIHSRINAPESENWVFFHITYDWHVSIQDSVIRGLEELGIPFLWSPHSWASLIRPLKAVVVCEMNSRLVIDFRLYASTAPIVNICHGIGVIGKNFVGYSSAASNHYCVTSGFVGDQVRRNSLLDKDGVWVTGSPQMDSLFRNFKSKSDAVAGAQKNRVLITSTFNSECNAALILGDDPVQKVRGDDRSIPVMLSLHPHFRSVNPKLYDRWRTLATTEPNVTFHEGSTNIVDLLTTADLLISDFSSVVTMFLVCDKPIIRLIPEDRLGGAAYQADVFETELSQSCVTLPSVVGLADAVREALFSSEPDSRLLARSKLREKLFGEYTDGCAGLRVAKRISMLG